MRFLIVDGLIVVAAVMGWRAVRHLAYVFRDTGADDSSARLIRGIRALVMAAASVAFALGILYGSRGTMLIAAVILGEELYETGILLYLLRRR